MPTDPEVTYPPSGDRIDPCTATNTCSNDASTATTGDATMGNSPDPANCAPEPSASSAEAGTHVGPGTQRTISTASPVDTARSTQGCPSTSETQHATASSESPLPTRSQVDKAVTVRMLDNLRARNAELTKAATLAYDLLDPGDNDREFWACVHLERVLKIDAPNVENEMEAPDA